MAVTGITGGAEVVKSGGAVEERNDYLAGEAYAAGDLIRLAAGGTIKIAEAASAGAVHGLALEDASIGDVAKIVLFADDTLVSLPTIDGESPSDLTKSVAYTLNAATGAFAVTATDTNGVATVVSYADDGTPWDDRYDSFGQDSTVDNNRVIVRFKQTVLDGNVA